MFIPDYDYRDGSITLPNRHDLQSTIMEGTALVRVTGVTFINNGKNFVQGWFVPTANFGYHQSGARIAHSARTHEAHEPCVSWLGVDDQGEVHEVPCRCECEACMGEGSNMESRRSWLRGYDPDPTVDISLVLTHARRAQTVTNGDLIAVRGFLHTVTRSFVVDSHGVSSNGDRSTHSATEFATEFVFTQVDTTDWSNDRALTREFNRLLNL